MLSSHDRDTIESCLFEQGLGDLLVRNKERLHFTTDYSKVEGFLDTVDAIFMCLPTPEIGETGESDLRFYTTALKRLAEALARRNAAEQSKYLVIINKSTVPIDTIDITETILKEHTVQNYGIVSNPEFLVEGKAIEGSMRPDRVVVGAWKEEDFKIMRQVYQRFYDSPTVQYIEVTPKEAAASKLLANFYLFNKLAMCFDVIGRTCEAFSDIKFESIRKVLTADPRIGEWGFYDSLYAGGSCFIKDARSLSHQLQLQGRKAVLVNETYVANKRQLELFFARAEQEAEFSWNGKTVVMLGLAFKRDTNDIRNSPAIDLVNWLIEKQAHKICLYDPVAQESFKKIFPPDEKLQYLISEKDVIKQAEVIIIATDWPQFRGLADILINSETKPLIMDGRRMLQHRYEDLQKNGFNIIAVGSPFIKAG
jgi:UDPglucose 6-dehydrogenase